MKLVIGTAQFGLDYGVSNRLGQVDKKTVKAILQLAAQQGVCLLDTAPAYGRAEQVLGGLSGVWHAKYGVITKTPTCSQAQVDENFLATCDAGLKNSLAALGIPRVAGLLVHGSDDLLIPGGARLWEWLIQQKQDGIVEKVGVSVYSVQQIDAICEHFIPDLVQIPINLWNQQFVIHDYLDTLKQQGVEVHARSVMLQGLFAMQVAELPKHLEQHRIPLQILHEFCKEEGVDVRHLAVQFVHQFEEVDHLVMGFTSEEELAQCLTWIEEPVAEETLRRCSELAVTEEAIINPANW